MGTNRLRIFCLVFLLQLAAAVETNRARALAAPTGENAVDGEEHKVVTLGPPRDGVQRAVLDEVEANQVNQQALIDDKGREPELEAYDDHFVDIREEQPLFVPRPYRNETTPKPTTTTTMRPIATQPVGQTLPMANLVTQPPVFAQPQPQPLPQPPQPQQPLPQPFPQVPPRVQPQPIATSHQAAIPAQPMPQPFRPPSVQPQQPQFTQFPQQPQPQPQAPFFRQPQQQTFQFQNRQPQQPAPVPFFPQQNQQFAQFPQQPNLRGPPAIPRPFGGFRPPFAQQTQEQPQTVPVRPRPQPPHSPPRVVVPSSTPLPPGTSTSVASIRTGVCHASIFYISSPMSPQASTITFTHFAVTVSADQCARTCHEFNCAVAHYDPVSGHCQFNPSTSFLVREGQCPRWPSPHYRNNVPAVEAMRIFCVTCHRPLRKGRRRGRGRFRTRLITTEFTGRVAQQPGVGAHALAAPPPRGVAVIDTADRDGSDVEPMSHLLPARNRTKPEGFFRRFEIKKKVNINRGVEFTRRGAVATLAKSRESSEESPQFH